VLGMRPFCWLARCSRGRVWVLGMRAGWLISALCERRGWRRKAKAASWLADCSCERVWMLRVRAGWLISALCERRGWWNAKAGGRVREVVCNGCGIQETMIALVFVKGLRLLCSPCWEQDRENDGTKMHCDECCSALFDWFAAQESEWSCLRCVQLKV
jgi:hypothetical protein